MTGAAVHQHPVRFSGTARLASPPRRIASLLPSATEIVCDLGLADRLVAVTHECDYPPEVVSALPRVTADRIPEGARRSGEIDAAVRSALSDGHGLYMLDEGLLADLRPDLILTQELCPVCAVAYPAVLQAARAAGGGSEPLVVSLEPHTLADALATIRLVAGLAGAQERGDALLAELERRLGTIAQPSLRRRVALVEWLEPLFAPGHWVPDQVRAAGGEPVIGAAGQRSRETSWEELAAAEPEVVILGLCGFDLARTLDEWHAFRPPKALRDMLASARVELWALDGSAYVSRPGPRLVEGVEVIAGILAGRPDERALRLTPRWAPTAAASVSPTRPT